MRTQGVGYLWGPLSSPPPYLLESQDTVNVLNLPLVPTGCILFQPRLHAYNDL